MTNTNQQPNSRLNLRLHYPASDIYTYMTRLERINLDEECMHDITNGKGFIITNPKPIKDDLKDMNGMFSPRFGRGLQDLDPYSDRYKCRCGHLKSKFNENQECPICHTKVTFVDDDFSYFGWIRLKDNYWFIHPGLFMSIASFIGYDNLMDIISIQTKEDEDGNDIGIKRPRDKPFLGIGMIEFHRRFDEIMEWYKNNKGKTKQDRYDDIMSCRDKIFCHSLPVFTTLLRPWKAEGGELHYESTNATYKILGVLAAKINSDKLVMNQNKKSKNELLFDFQKNVKKLFDEINKILSGKKGSVRTLFGGRFNFSARSVIIPDPTLRIDEVKLSYQCLVGFLQQRIINILNKAYNMQYNEAYVFLDANRRNKNKIIEDIIMSIIQSEPRGLPLIINRNPTLVYGGILQVYCIGMCDGYTMALSLQVLKGLAADLSNRSIKKEGKYIYGYFRYVFECNRL